MTLEDYLITKLPSKLHMFAYVDVLAPFCTVTVHQSLVELILENGWSNIRGFLGVSASQLQAVEHFSFAKWRREGRKREAQVGIMFNKYSSLREKTIWSTNIPASEQRRSLYPENSEETTFSLISSGNIGDFGHNSLIQKVCLGHPKSLALLYSAPVATRSPTLVRLFCKVSEQANVESGFTSLLKVEKGFTIFEYSKLITLYPFTRTGNPFTYLPKSPYQHSENIQMQNTPNSTPETISITQKLRKRIDARWITTYWTVHQVEYHTVEKNSLYCARSKFLLATEDSDPLHSFITTSAERNRGTDLEAAIFGIPPFKKEDTHIQLILFTASLPLIFNCSIEKLAKKPLETILPTSFLFFVTHSRRPQFAHTRGIKKKKIKGNMKPKFGVDQASPKGRITLLPLFVSPPLRHQSRKACHVLVRCTLRISQDSYVLLELSTNHPLHPSKECTRDESFATHPVSIDQPLLRFHVFLDLFSGFPPEIKYKKCIKTLSDTVSVIISINITRSGSYYTSTRESTIIISDQFSAKINSILQHVDQLILLTDSHIITPGLLLWHFHTIRLNSGLNLVINCVDFKLKNQPDLFAKLSCYNPSNMHKSDLHDHTEIHVVNAQAFIFCLEMIITHISYVHHFITLIFFFFIHHSASTCSITTDNPNHRSLKKHTQLYQTIKVWSRVVFIKRINSLF
ncbi:hypothetical protein VP01_1379g2 [Puccinia sorghi]|uniref:Uncharacterized protein n=1 Tax=Puccinia sorghi TaxID=27349 RepID=A0A0L6VLF6_9BASI|nr:hypothetical protein VP01_1379g2 [Puccinia sorghi]